jgi:hypothetical protein
LVVPDVAASRPASLLGPLSPVHRGEKGGREGGRERGSEGGRERGSEGERDG